MSKDLHDMDENFRSAYREFTDDNLSPGVWEKINATLDKKEASSYRKKSRNWKRIAILSLLLLTGFILFDTIILKTGFPHSKENARISAGAKESEKNRERQNEIVSKPHHFSPAKIIGEQSQNLTKKISGNTGIVTQNRSIHLNLLLKTKKREIAGALSSTKDKELPKKDRTLLAREMIFHPVEENHINEMITRQLSSGKKTGHLEITDNSFSIISEVKKIPSKINFFKPYWTITIYASSDHAGYRLDKDLPTIVEIKQHEEHEPSFSAGILATRQFKKDWALQSGLIYSNTNIAISSQTIYASQAQAGTVLYKYVTSSGYAYIKPGFNPQPSPGDSLTAESAQHNLQHLVAPLIVQYTILRHNKMTFSASLGVAGNFLTSAKIETEVGDGFNRQHVLINKLNGMRQIYWSIMADADIEYMIAKQVSINLRPGFRYALTPITRNDDLETFPYSFGLGVGVTYKF